MQQHAFPADQLVLLFERDTVANNSEWIPSDAQLTQWVLAALTHSLACALFVQRVEVSISCADATHIGELNAHYRSKNSPTNVLSFPADMPVLPSSESDELATVVLGDVVVCPEVLVTEAQEQGKALADHWAHMLIHSVLHLNGLDHEDESAANAMESLEIQILSTLGISNPYLAVSAKQS